MISAVNRVFISQDEFVFRVLLEFIDIIINQPYPVILIG